ncbi:unnamed protein product [Haemonchus placei]|uniref:C2H2-type domain-containing protein n=1 Tax=Haemonchus placei TaxID=6290 RepID=A0A0N4WB50_HAEPC|nr:unnamed protein product [Haemonchus placei]
MFAITAEKSIVHVRFVDDSSRDLINCMNIFANGHLFQRAQKTNTDIQEPLKGRTDLVRHSAVHAPPKEKCPQCDERFRWKKQLDKHMITHSETALKQPYLCHICDSTYATGHGLTRHLSRKHECPIPEGFSRFASCQ